MCAVFKITEWRIWQLQWWRSQVEAIWNWVGAHHDQVKIVFAVCAALFILWEYHDKQIEERVSKTYDFQARLASGDLQKARLDLNFLLIGNWPTIKAAGPGGSDLIAEMVRKAQLERNVLLLADFYTQAATCARLNLCELGVACAAFKTPVVAFRHNFFSLFEEWKKDWGEDFAAESFDYFTSNCKTE